LRVRVEYRDTTGDVLTVAPGYGGLYYTDDSGRKDIVISKVAVGPRHVSFYASGSALNFSADQDWMLSDNARPGLFHGWCGYDFLINQEPAESGFRRFLNTGRRMEEA
jgi:hypothetical protein